MYAGLYFLEVLGYSNTAYDVNLRLDPWLIHYFPLVDIGIAAEMWARTMFRLTSSATTRRTSDHSRREASIAFA